VTTITVDGLNEDTFRRVIEGRLRQGKAGEAVDKLRLLLAPYAGPGRILPERFMTVSSSDLVLIGWDSLGESIARHDRPGSQITALSIAFGWPGEDPPVADADGKLSPHLEVAYFTDEAYPFSQSGRDDLLDGYSYHGCTWSDQGMATDSALALAGIDDLHGALALLEARLLDCEAPDVEEIRAGSLGACLLSVLLVQAVGERIERDGLPRPICVLSGSNGVYPYFDAPVAGIPADILKAAENEDEDALPLGQGVPTQRYSSLMVTSIPRARKRAVLVLNESPEETAQRNASLRGMGLGEAGPAEGSPAPAVFEPQDLPVPSLPPEITPVPGGPLMVRKKPSESWDFRDLLSPAEPERPATDSLPIEPPALFEDARPTEPEDLPVPRLPLGRIAEPGFALLEPSVHDRLQSLIAPPAALELPELVPANPADTAPEILDLTEDQAQPEFAAPDLGPVWPLGIGWLEDAEVELKDAVAEAMPSSSSLWARLRGWLRRGA
jgi:hypothetical protein